jgi:DNA modification methylase
MRTGRNFIGFELSKEYHTIAMNRIAAETEEAAEAEAEAIAEAVAAAAAIEDDEDWMA